MRTSIPWLARKGIPLAFLAAMGACEPWHSAGEIEPGEDTVTASPSAVQPATFLQRSKLVAISRQPEEVFASAIAISGDTLAIGAPGNPERGEKSGAVYIFVRIGAAWIHQAKLMPSDGKPFLSFGSSVAIAGDTLIVGALNDNIMQAGAFSGSAYVFIRHGTQWGQYAQLLPSDGGAARNDDRYGASVAIIGDTALVGAPERPGNTDPGKVYVFRSSRDRWVQRGTLQASDGIASNEFGVALATSGNTVVVGAPGNGAFDVPIGLARPATYVFSRNREGFEQQAKITGGAGRGRFAGSVAISGDTIAIGSVDRFMPGDGGPISVFSRSGGRWLKQAELASPDPRRMDTRFGRALSISGEMLVVGDPDVETAYVYGRNGSQWTLQDRITRKIPTGDAPALGSAIAIARNSVFVGAPEEDSEEYLDSGALYEFVRER